MLVEDIEAEVYMPAILFPEDVEDPGNLIPAILDEEEAGYGPQVKG